MSIVVPPIWFFRGLRLQDRLPFDVYERLRSEGRVERWGHHAQIHHAPGSGDVYVVLKGSVSIWKLPSSGGRAARLKPGDVFGALGAPMDDVARPLVQAFDDTTLVAFEREQFNEQIARHIGTIKLSSKRLRRNKGVEMPLRPLLYTSPAHTQWPRCSCIWARAKAARTRVGACVSRRRCERGRCPGASA